MKRSKLKLKKKPEDKPPGKPEEPPGKPDKPPGKPDKDGDPFDLASAPEVCLQGTVKIAGNIRIK